MKIQMKVPKLRRNNKYMKIGSFSLIKELNTSIILNTIKEKGSISRAEIAKLTGLTAATVTNITSQLLKYNLVIETRYGASSGGRKPILLEFNYSYYNVIGVVISKQEITTSLTDLNSNLIKDIKVNLKDNVEKKDVINIVIKNTKELINFSEKKVLGLGVSVEGLIDEKNGVVVMSSSLGWKNFNIKNELNKELNIPIFINNDVKALAKGEEMFGKGRESSNFILLYTGFGIGASLVHDGVIYRGISNYACELGHITIDINGPLCSCGNHGCFQALASGEALIKEIKSSNLKSLFDDEITVNDIIKKIYENNHDILKLIEKQAGYIGIGIANIINIFNPSEIIINGYISCGPKYIKDIIINEVNNRSLLSMRESVNVLFSDLATKSQYKGAVGLFISELFANPEFFF